MTETAHHGHDVRMTSWIAVVLIVVASILFGFALPMHSISLTIAGGLVMLVGLVVAVAYRIMDDAY